MDPRPHPPGLEPTDFIGEHGSPLADPPRADSGTVHRPAGEPPNVLDGDAPFGSVAGSSPTPHSVLPSGSYSFLSPTDRPGELGQLGPYRVVRLLGKGGMGFVFRAEDDGLHRPVALKVMRPEVAAEATARERFLREGRSAAAIKSDHVITIYQVGEANGVPFLAMEYLEGWNLDDWLNAWQKSKNRPVQATAVVRVAKDVLKGLVAAHEKGLIHRDIKPANLWVEAKTSRVKLLDFGLTRGGESDTAITRSGQILGTPAFMAPEQARGLRLDARADLFSVGIVLYRMISGRNPFQRDSVFATLTALAVDDPPPAASFGVVPDDLAALIDRLLAKSPEGRPASAKAALAVVLEVEQQLRSGLAASSGIVPVSAGPIPSVETRPEPVPEANVVEGELVEPASEITIRPIATPPVPLVQAAPRLPEPVWPSLTPRSWSSVRALPEERPTVVSPRRNRKRNRKRKGRWGWYGIIASGVVTVLVISAAAMIVAKMSPDRRWPTSRDDRTDTALAKRGGDTPFPHLGATPTTKGVGEQAPPPKSSGEPAPPVPSVSPKSEPAPPVPSVSPRGEVVQEFEYVIEGEKRKGSRSVLTLAIGGGETMEFVRIPKGPFLMGAPEGETVASPDEKQHQVEITQEFYLGKYEVTQAQYKAVTGADPSHFKGNRLPVEMVSWEDATAFCSTLSGRVKRKVELPTEAEWEFACRAGTTTPFHFGSRLNGDLANCNGSTPYATVVKGANKRMTVEVGLYPANPWGLHDMHGNVWEWCRDYYGPYDKVEGLKDPFQSTKQAEDRRVLRGGSWRYSARLCRAAHRDKNTPDDRGVSYGFRVSLRLDW